MEEAAALCALGELLLVEHCLARGPHCAFLDTAVDGHLGLLGGGGGEGGARLQVAIVDVDIDVEVGLGVARGVHGAACVGVLVEGREGVRRVEGGVLLVLGGGHLGVGRGRGAQALRLLVDGGTKRHGLLVGRGRHGRVDRGRVRGPVD